MSFGAFLMPAKSEEELPRDWDVIIVGGGPGGLTAGIYLARYGLRTLVIEKDTPGGKVSINPVVENYPGFTYITGEELSKIFHEHASKAGVKILFPEEVVRLDLKGDWKKVYTRSGKEFSARALIIATGAEDKRLEVPGEMEFYGKGVSYCAVCDGPLFKGKKIVVVGGGNTAAVSTLYLAKLASKVILVHRRDKLRAEQALVDQVMSLPNVEFRWKSVVTEVVGDERVRGVRIRNLESGEEELVEAEGVFIFVGVIPQSHIAKQAGVKTDEKGFILVDYWQRTNCFAVYAVGDVTGEPMQIAKAVGEGVKAATDIHDRIFGGAYGEPKASWHPTPCVPED